jgi:hypothetical protein
MQRFWKSEHCWLVFSIHVPFKQLGPVHPLEHVHTEGAVKIKRRNRKTLHAVNKISIFNVPVQVPLLHPFTAPLHKGVVQDTPV